VGQQRADAAGMATSPVRDSLVLRSPDAMVAALPYLVGFTPHESATAVWIAAGRLILTQRMDLAGWLVDSRAWLAALFEHPSARAADQLVMVLTSSSEVPTSLVDDLRAAAEQRDVLVRDILIVGDGRWRSAMCADEACCPRVGRPIDPQVLVEVSAEFTVMGAAPLADRDELLASLSADPGRIRRVEASARRPRRGRDIEGWRDESIERIVRLLLPDSRVHGTAAPGGLADVDDVAALLHGLADIRVRDTVLWELAAAHPDALLGAMAQLTAGVRAAPEPLVAPIATTCAVAAWLLGDGARASIAAERALSARPDYTLGQLVLQSLRGGLPPTTWRSAMAGVSRDECRHGITNADRQAG